MLILGLVFHIAEVGLIGLMVIILVAALNGVTDEGEIGNPLKTACPFTSFVCGFLLP